MPHPSPKQPVRRPAVPNRNVAMKTSPARPNRFPCKRAILIQSGVSPPKPAKTQPNQNRTSPADAQPILSTKNTTRAILNFVRRDKVVEHALVRQGANVNGERRTM